MAKIADNITALVGNTPLVRLNRVTDGAGAEVLAKLEFYNPAKSVKDRIGVAMIDAAEKAGKLGPGVTIVEPTSGNTGIALAMVAAARGYKIILTMPETMSKERRMLLRAYGAELILTPGPEGMGGAIGKATEIANSDPTKYFMPQQFENPANPAIHRATTAEEIWRDTDGKVDAIVGGVGTGGTIAGLGKALKDKNPAIKIIAVEPPLGERVEGLRNMDEGYIPPVFDNWHGQELLDRKRVVRPRESIEWTRRIVKECSIFAGISTGAALAGAVKVAKDLDEGTIVFIVCDGGWKYLSTGAYTDDLDEAEARAEKIIYF